MAPGSERLVNVHEAKTHLSALLQEVARGEAVTIARAGRPVARLVPLDDPLRARGRIGFLEGEARIPDDFDSMGGDEIAAMFGSPE